MKLLKNSKEWIVYFLKHNPIHSLSFTHKTKSLLYTLYNEIYEAYSYIHNHAHYTTTIRQITSTSQIIRPMYFNAKSFPEIIYSHIDEHMVSEISYSTSLYDRKVRVYFVSEKSVRPEEYDTYMKSILMWLYIVNKYASKKCAKSITIYIYLTSLLKRLPRTNEKVLDETNVNTAFTSTCPSDSEIIIFRKEEWFKVFIHETFHNFGLDYSMMNNGYINKCIISMFDIKSEVNSYEAYTECWAEIMNTLFCSFMELNHKQDVQRFLSMSEHMLNVERKYSFFQMVKTLNFMGLTYKDLYSTTQTAREKRILLYKEESNVFAYYILKTILLNNIQGFLDWCDKHNDTSLLNFKKTMNAQKSFCQFIERSYKSKSMIQNVHLSEDFFNELYKKQRKNGHLLDNMRMTICELG